MDTLWAHERARARKVQVAEKTSLRWARTDDDREDWARAALLEADRGAASPFICLDEGRLRNVRVALLIPGSTGAGKKEALMHDDRFRDQINELCRAGAVVVNENQKDPSDVLLVSEAFNLRDTIRCFGLPGLQEQERCVLWEPFVDEALASSTAVLGEDEASVALRKKHGIFWRTPCGARYNGKDPDVIDDIPRVPLGSSNSFRVHPEVLEASDRRAAARLDASRGPGRRRRRGR